MSSDHAIRQIAYFVKDVRQAAMDHMALYGSGPFFVADHIPLHLSQYRGQDAPLDHSASYGQWGSLMVEFIQQNNPGPSAFHDLYPEGSGREGVHHVALIVNDLKAAMTSFNHSGYETALYAEMKLGLAFAMMDTSSAYGHMTELYMPEPALIGFYEMVAEASKGFNGRDPLRPISF